MAEGVAGQGKPSEGPVLQCMCAWQGGSPGMTFSGITCVPYPQVQAVLGGDAKGHQSLEP